MSTTTPSSSKQVFLPLAELHPSASFPYHRDVYCCLLQLLDAVAHHYDHVTGTCVPDVACVMLHLCTQRKPVQVFLRVDAEFHLQKNEKSLRVSSQADPPLWIPRQVWSRPHHLQPALQLGKKEILLETQEETEPKQISPGVEWDSTPTPTIIVAAAADINQTHHHHYPGIDAVLRHNVAEEPGKKQKEEGQDTDDEEECLSRESQKVLNEIIPASVVSDVVHGKQNAVIAFNGTTNSGKGRTVSSLVPALFKQIQQELSSGSQAIEKKKSHDNHYYHEHEHQRELHTQYQVRMHAMQDYMNELLHLAADDADMNSDLEATETERVFNIAVASGNCRSEGTIAVLTALEDEYLNDPTDENRSEKYIEKTSNIIRTIDVKRCALELSDTYDTFMQYSVKSWDGGPEELMRSTTATVVKIVSTTSSLSRNQDEIDEREKTGAQENQVVVGRFILVDLAPTPTNSCLETHERTSRDNPAEYSLTHHDEDRAIRAAHENLREYLQLLLSSSGRLNVHMMVNGPLSFKNCSEKTNLVQFIHHHLFYDLQNSGQGETGMMAKKQRKHDPVVSLVLNISPLQCWEQGESETLNFWGK